MEGVQYMIKILVNSNISNYIDKGNCFYTLSGIRFSPEQALVINNHGKEGNADEIVLWVCHSVCHMYRQATGKMT